MLMSAMAPRGSVVKLVSTLWGASPAVVMMGTLWALMALPALVGTHTLTHSHMHTLTYTHTCSSTLWALSVPK